MDDGGAGQKKENTISNLPLLFANGYPTSLEKITEAQLAKFIPFMVQCSLGNVQTGTSTEQQNTASPVQVTVAPTWWPDDILFELPLTRPASTTLEDWTTRLKELVCMCYEHHNNVFLLRFCTVLSKYEPECLRFINNYNSTTSLYDRFNNKLLVTFRNENMLYDREYNPNRICLLPRRKAGATTTTEEIVIEDLTEPSMVEPPLFDIYLCDYCDAELYSLEACREHEKNCRETSEQGGEESDEEATGATIASAVKRRNRKRAAQSERTAKARERKRKLQQAYEEIETLDFGNENNDDDDEDSMDGVLDGAAADTAVPEKDDQMRYFLSNFQLVSAKGVPAENMPPRSPRKNGLASRSPLKSAAEKAKANDKRRRNDRNVLTVQRCATVPLSSPMGKFLLRSQKTMPGRDYMLERNDRVERFCPAPVIRDSIRPRWLTSSSSETFPVTYRAIDYRGMFEKDEGYDRNYVHRYRFPRRQLSERSRELCWLAFARILVKSCRPCSVDVVRLTQYDIRVYFLHLAIEKKKRELMELRTADLMRMYVHQQRQLKRPPDEYIDLCSSDDEAAEPASSSNSGGDSTGRGPAIAAAKRQKRVDEDEAKENREDDQSRTDSMTTAGLNRFVRILPKPSGGAGQPVAGGGGGIVSDQLQRQKLQPQRNILVGQPRSSTANSQIGTTSNCEQVGTRNTVAQQWTGNAPGQLVANNSSTPLIANWSPIVVSSGLGVPLTTSPQVIGQPSSYLFLTKQQLVYQQLELTSTVAAAQVVPGNEIEREVVSSGVEKQASEQGRSVYPSNSPLGGGQRTILGNSDSVGIHKEPVSLKVDAPVDIRRNSTATRTTARKSFSVRDSQSNFSNAPRLRRTSSACETFPKKLPSLIRIAPAISGE